MPTPSVDNQIRSPGYVLWRREKMEGMDADEATEARWADTWSVDPLNPDSEAAKKAERKANEAKKDKKVETSSVSGNALTRQVASGSGNVLTGMA